LQTVSTNDFKVGKEKFDRKQLFTSVQEYLGSHAIRESDIAIAEDLFMENAEVEMVKFIASNYSMDAYEIMKELNARFGFTLFKYVQSANTK